MTSSPSFDDLFAVMSAVSVGDGSVRVAIPPEPALDHLPTRFGIALNILLDDLAEHNEQRLRTLLDSVQDYAIIMLESDGTIASWNAGAQRLLGYVEKEIVGNLVSVFYPPSEATDAEAELATVRREGRAELEGWRVRKDGSRFWANVVTTAVTDADGAIVGFAKVTRDLTERKRAEEAVRVAHEELEAFSYSVAHDLRAPLRAINGFAELVLDDYTDKLDAEGQRFLRAIRQNTEKMADLIDGLLLLARMTRSELKRTQIDLVPLVRDVVIRLRNSDAGRNVDLVVPDSLDADADPRLVRALLENLVGNAWKFTSKTAMPRIELGVNPSDGLDPCTFWIWDNGAGFDMAFVQKLFGPFQRLHTAAEFPGDGIGLATSQRIVQRHGGKIWAEGKVGAGATFYFTLPAAPR